VVLFLTSGRGDEHLVAEWIHQAYAFSRRSRRGYPLLGLVDALERLLQGPDAFLSAWEPLLEDADPWVRALARLHLGKMRIMLGQDGPEADTYLEAALAEFRVLGERFGISFAQSELAERLAVRGDFATACAHYEQAIAVVSELGATEDVIRMRSLQARLYWLLGDRDASAAALAEARRRAERATWPHALAELALARSDLARWGGDAEEARRQLDAATALLGEDADRANLRALTHDLRGYLTDDLDEARTHRTVACAAASEAGYAPLIAQVLVGVADLALRRDQDEQAARLLAASTAVRGLPDRSHPDAARIERTARSRLGDVAYAEAAREGTRTSWSRLVEVTLAS
jgi:tetratricopeptide (TPR) repeat protein